jgi:hypothetical protein
VRASAHLVLDTEPVPFYTRTVLYPKTTPLPLGLQLTYTTGVPPVSGARLDLVAGREIHPALALRVAARRNRTVRPQLQKDAEM